MRSPWQRRDPLAGSRTTTQQALRRFGVLAAATAVVVAVGSALVSDVLAEQEALRDATSRTEGMARGLAVPFLTRGMREGEPEALRRFDEVMRARIGEGGVTHIVVWDDSGRVLWSDEARFVRASYPLSDGASQALTTLDTVANLPGSRSTHTGDFYPEEDQLEVYVGAVGRDGEPFVFEAYLPPDRIAVDYVAVLPKLLGVSLGSLFLICLAAVPLALSLARRLDEAERRQVAAMDRSVGSWRHQRRLLAQELHDGVTQDLAALRYGLSILTSHEAADETSGVVLAKLRASAEHAEASVRSLVLDLTPRRLAQEGLLEAVGELAGRYRTYGLAVHTVLPARVACPEGTGILAYRVVREGLRNVVRHSDAQRVEVRLGETSGAGALEVVITDDGGRPATADELRSGQGLGLLADTLADLGGSLRLGPGAAGGTRLLAVVPLVETEPGRP